MRTRARGTIVVVDNSPTTIDGDFVPNRLEAQKITIQQLAYNFSQTDSNSQIGIITMSRPENGIRSSLTSNPKNTISSLSTITQGKTECDIENGLKCAMMALNHPETPIGEKRILLMIGSSVPNITQQKCLELNKAIDSMDITLDIVVFGTNTTNTDILRCLNHTQVTKAVFLHVEECPTALWELVIATSGMIKCDLFPKTALQSGKKDRILEETLQKSLMEQKHDNPYYITDQLANVMPPIKKKQKKKPRKKATGS